MSNVFRSENIKIWTYAGYIKLWDKNNNKFQPYWTPLGFATGNLNVETTTETKEMNVLFPQVIAQRVISKIDQTISFSLAETHLENLAIMMFQQNVVNDTEATSPDSININAADFDNTTPYSSNPVYILKKAVPKITPTNWQVLDSNNNDITSDFDFVIQSDGRATLICKNPALPPDDPFTLNYVKYNVVGKKAIDLFNDITMVGIPVRLLFIGRNQTDRNLRAIYFPKAVFEKPATIGLYNEDFQKLEVSFKPLIEYPSGMSPIDPNVPYQYARIVDFTYDTPTNLILAYFNVDHYQELPQ